MNEIKKLRVLLVIVVVIILLILAVVIIDSKNQAKLYEEFTQSLNGEEKKLIYIGRPSCGYCNLLQPSLEEMKERYNFDYVYINSDEIDSKYLEKIIADLKIESFGTPYLAVVSKGEVVATQPEYVDYEKLFNFLQTNSIISSNEKLLLNYIGIDEYTSLINDGNANVIVVGKSTCSYCVQAKLVLNQVVSKNDVEINYLNYDYLDQEGQTTVFGSFDYFKGEWGTPVMLIVKDNEIVAMLEGYTTYDKYVSFLQGNGVL